jgi:hypothetical protein
MRSTLFLPKNITNRIPLKKVDVIIIGAGPAGLSSATTLRENGKKVILLEKESIVGGKCNTFSEPTNRENKTEWGAALVAPNYGKLIDKIKEKVKWESILPCDTSTLPFQINFDQMSLLQKAQFSFEFTKQMAIFAFHAKEYQRLRDLKQDLPEDYKISFSDFAKKYTVELINDFSYLLVPAFGYGLMESCPAYAVFEYYGMSTLPELTLGKIVQLQPLLSIKNGFQTLMEEIAKDFEIKLNSVVESIERNKEGILVKFKTAEGLFSIYADSLVLAISPLHWTKLGMKLSQAELSCVKNITYYQYPVAVVKLQGYPPRNYYEYQGLIESGLGHLALITTRDNRDNPPDGRLCTAYINLPNKSEFVFTPDTIKQLENDLLNIPGVTGVEILQTKVWQDYMSTLPWEKRLELDKNQMNDNTNTLYVGPYTLGGFEDVACVWEQADKAVSEFVLNKKRSYDFSYYLNELYRTATFFAAPKELPFNNKSATESKLTQSFNMHANNGR